MDEKKPLMSSQEVADYLGVPLQTLYVWSMNGTGPSGYAVGRHRRYRREEVDAWLEQRQTGRAA
jgi:excisionase family DNA binding protein